MGVSLGIAVAFLIIRLVTNIARQLAMGARKVARAERSDQRELAREAKPCADLRQRGGVSWSGEAHQFEAGALARQACAAADCADDDASQCHRGVEIARCG